MLPDDAYPSIRHVSAGVIGGPGAVNYNLDYPPGFLYAIDISPRYTTLNSMQILIPPFKGDVDDVCLVQATADNVDPIRGTFRFPFFKFVEGGTLTVRTTLGGVTGWSHQIVFWYKRQADYKPGVGAPKVAIDPGRDP